MIELSPSSYGNPRSSVSLSFGAIPYGSRAGAFDFSSGSLLAKMLTVIL